jgi:hypothetical protein
MTDPNLIAQFIEILIALVGTHLPKAAAAQFFVEMAQKGKDAYENQTGQPLNPDFVRNEEAF